MDGYLNACSPGGPMHIRDHIISDFLGCSGSLRILTRYLPQDILLSLLLSAEGPPPLRTSALSAMSPL